MEIYNSRNEVPKKYKWDLTDLFKDIDDFYKEIEEVREKINTLDSYAGCTKNSDKLLEYIEYNNDISFKLINLEIYAMLINDQDLNESIGTELVGKTDRLLSDYEVKSSFFAPELLKLDSNEYENLFKNEKLKKYKKLLDETYRYKKHILNKEEEELSSRLTSMSGNYSQMASTLLNSCNDYGEVKMPDGTKETLMTTNYRRIMKKLPRKKREKVYNQFNEVIDRYANISAGLLDSYVKTNIELSKIHKYASTWDEKLFNLKLSDKIFNSLIEAALETKNVLKKFFDLKSKVLKVDKCAPWDAPINLYETDKEYTIEEACEIITNALKPLGDDYVKRFKTIIDERCVDFCQYKGKCDGGYNVSSNTLKNSKILMSFNYDLNSISTLAHEAGHHIYHQYVYENNIEPYRITEIIVTEVASLTNEFLLSNYLINNGNKEEALSGLSNIISTFQDNFYGSVQEGNFEQEFYKYVENGGTLTKDYLYKLCEESLIKFYPYKPVSKFENCSWVMRSHYYMFYYLFSYAVCISVAAYVSKEILSGNNEMLNNYIKFLKAGSENDISDIYKILGIDLEDKNLYIKAMDYLELLIDKFDELYNEI